jgi:hypothetical protein
MFVVPNGGELGQQPNAAAVWQPAIQKTIADNDVGDEG